MSYLGFVEALVSVFYGLYYGQYDVFEVYSKNLTKKDILANSFLFYFYVPQRPTIWESMILTWYDANKQV